MTSQYFSFFLKLILILIITGFIIGISSSFAESEYIVDAWVERRDITAMEEGRKCPIGFQPNSMNVGCESVEKKWVQIPIYFAEHFYMKEYCNDPHYPVGCVVTYLSENRIDRQEIYLVKGYQGTSPSHGGCNVLYHELLHVMGITHVQMVDLYPNSECKNRR